MVRVAPNRIVYPLTSEIIWRAAGRPFLRRTGLRIDDVVEIDELQGIVQMVSRQMGEALISQAARLGKWPDNIVPLDLGGDTYCREVDIVERPRHSRQPMPRRLAQMRGSSSR